MFHECVYWLHVSAVFSFSSIYRESFVPKFIISYSIRRASEAFAELPPLPENRPSGNRFDMIQSGLTAIKTSTH